MPNERELSRSNPYYLPRETFLTVIHWVRQYPTWLAIKAAEKGPRGVSYDGERVQSNGLGDPTAHAAIRMAQVSSKIEIVERCAQEVAKDLASWIILGTCYQLTYNQLRERGIPCGKDLYYKLRRQFYFAISNEI